MSQSPSTTGPTHQDQDGSLNNNNCAVEPSGVFNNQLTTSSLKKLLPEAKFVTPLDELLCSAQGQGRQARTWQDQAASHWPKPLQADPIKSSEMFLRPSSLLNDEKILRIVDFVDSIIPRDNEHLLSSVGQAKITISYGHIRPKLESVTLVQWVVANTCIFYTLLAGGQLPTFSDVQHYLASSVKIMELSAKHTWLSVLKYDDEFRHLQGVYRYPWSFDSHHLAISTLEPLTTSLSASKTQPQVGAGGSRPTGALAPFARDGRVIYHNYNRQKGCFLPECNYAHVCNVKVNGKACSSPHPGHQHPTSTTPATPQTA